MVDIKGYEGYYAIDEEGRVWSYRSHRYLKPQIVGAGYQKVTLCKNGEKENQYIHRLVAKAFIPNPNDLPQINHLDEDKTNNRVENLEWTTTKENLAYGTRVQRSADSHKKPVYCVELDKVFDSAAQAGRELQLTSSNITACCKGKKLKTCGGYHWRYN